METTEKPIEKPTVKQPRFSSLRQNKTAVSVIGLAVAAVIGFGGGVLFEKGEHHAPGAIPFNRAGFMRSGQIDGPGGSRRAEGMGNRGGMGIGGPRHQYAAINGSVSAVSNDSLTVLDARTNTSVTLTISDNTTITNQGAKAKAGDIKTGDHVLVRTSTTSSNTATAIDITQ